ncbi:hypothetical protein Pan161_14520 [Gimesia algae]|uniref:Uncharacterized protein n=1 Tax=Gimesia algae TaxID=2527971 RepID=A0A517VA01_9PLAN|nr:hypothetical protein Pan161_14520 [Gimesia algae]
MRVQPFLCLCKEASFQYKKFVLGIDCSLNENISFNEAEDASLDADELLSYATELSDKEVLLKPRLPQFPLLTLSEPQHILPRNFWMGGAILRFVQWIAL